jgi:hypothetical protein
MSEPAPVWIGFEEAYVVRAVRDYSHAVSFRVVKINGISIPDGALCFPKWNDYTEDFDEADAFLSGDIKWDGCSNWDFHTDEWDFHTDECMAHFCGRSNAERVGRLLGALYDLAAEMMPDVFDKELAA